MNPVLSVIIVSYNTREMTLACLRALYADLDAISAEVFVVDNASSDGSVEAIRARYPAVHVIASAKNLGFGAGNNLAMKEARGRYFLLLNTDAFPKPGAIATLIKELESQPKAGVIGPRLLNPDDSLQISCFKFPSPFRAWVENMWLSAALPSHGTIGDYRRWAHDTAREVEWLIGACMLVRRAVYEQVGGFDERFFMYAEESDWQLRIRQAGWKIVFTPAARVTHLAGASFRPEGKAAASDAGVLTGDSPVTAPVRTPASLVRINPHFFNSLDYYERKHHGVMGLFSLRVAMIYGCSARLWLWLLASLVPSRREQARQKVRLHAWLVWRQLTTPAPIVASVSRR